MVGAVVPRRLREVSSASKVTQPEGRRARLKPGPSDSIHLQSSFIAVTSAGTHCKAKLYNKT